MEAGKQAIRHHTYLGIRH